MITKIKLNGFKSEEIPFKFLCLQAEHNKSILTILETVVALEEDFNNRGFFKLSDIAKDSVSVRPEYNFIYYKIVNGIIGIVNNKELSINFKYLTNLAENELCFRGTERNNLSVTVEMDKIENDLTIGEVILLLIETVGYKDTITIIDKVLLSFVLDDESIINRQKIMD